MPFDYTFIITKGGVSTSHTYQDLIRKLTIEKEIIQGAPMSEGGAPQAAWLQQLLLKHMKDTEIKVMFNGSQIF